jgi:hypothetical protein
VGLEEPESIIPASDIVPIKTHIERLDVHSLPDDYHICAQRPPAPEQPSLPADKMPVEKHVEELDVDSLADDFDIWAPRPPAAPEQLSLPSEHVEAAGDACPPMVPSGGDEGAFHWEASFEEEWDVESDEEDDCGLSF